MAAVTKIDPSPAMLLVKPVLVNLYVISEKFSGDKIRTASVVNWKIDQELKSGRELPKRKS